MNKQWKTVAKCPNCGDQCNPEWQYNYSIRLQRMTQERLWRCPKHEQLFRFYGGKLKVAFINDKVFRRL